MLGVAPAILLLAAASGSDLSTPASASARPSVCLVDTDARASHANRWSQIQSQPLAGFCSALSRAQIRLETQPRVTLALSSELAQAWPGRPEPLVLAARAQARLGAYAEAWPLWQAAQERGYQFNAAGAFRDYALTAALLGHDEAALSAYRRLVTLLALLPDPLARQRLYLEAASAALRRGSHFDEAAGYLAGARSGATSTGLRAYVAGLSAVLAWRRGGVATELEPLDAAEVWFFVARVRSELRPRHFPVLPRHEASAAASFLVEPYAATDAAELWQDYVQGLERTASDPDLLALARARSSRLLGRGARAR
jgi:tetratricopeptide (TPR) repeat protein